MRVRGSRLINASGFAFIRSNTADHRIIKGSGKPSEPSSFKNLIKKIAEEKDDRSAKEIKRHSVEPFRNSSHVLSPKEKSGPSGHQFVSKRRPTINLPNFGNLRIATGKDKDNLSKGVFKTEHPKNSLLGTAPLNNTGRPMTGNLQGRGETSARNRLQTILTSGGNPRRSEFYVAVSENTARLIGIAAFSLFSGSVVLLETIDNCLYDNTVSFLSSIKPKVILVRRSPSNLFSRLENHFEDSKIETVESFHFNETKGLEIYYQICKKKIADIEDRQYISLASLSCLFCYFLQAEEFFVDMGKLRLEHIQLKDYLVIGNDTARHLELVMNNADQKSKACLFDCFSCVTFGGGNIKSSERLLRANLLQPKISEPEIISRQTLVKKLKEASHAHHQILSSKNSLPDLSKFRCLDSLLVKLCGEVCNNESSSVYFCKALAETSTAAKVGAVLVDYLKKLGLDLPAVNVEKLGVIAEAIDDKFDASVLNLQAEGQKTTNRDRCFYFLKDRQSLAVDLARLSFARIEENISEASIRYGKVLGPASKVFRHSKLGYCLKVPLQLGSREDLESILQEPIAYKEEVQRQSRENCGYMLIQTDLLKRLSVTKLQSEQEILFETNQYVLLIRFIAQTLEVVHANLDALFEINRLVSLVDMLLHFALFANKQPIHCRCY